MEKFVVEVKKNGETEMLIYAEGKDKLDAMFNAKELLINKGEELKKLKCKIYREEEIGIVKK